MKSRAGEDLEPAKPDGACGSNAGLVLVESVRGRVFAHADIHAVRLVATVGVVEQHEIDIALAALRQLELSGRVVRQREPFDVTGRQPIGNRRGGTLPKSVERPLDVNAHFSAHPYFVNAVGALDSVAPDERMLKAFEQIRLAQ